MLQIGMNPNILETGWFIISWHGLLSFVGVALAVFLVARWASRGDLHVGKLEAELGAAVEAAINAASDYLRIANQVDEVDRASVERGKTALQTLEGVLQGLTLLPRTRVTVFTPEGDVVMDHAVPDAHTGHGQLARADLRAVLRGDSVTQERKLDGRNYAFLVYPVYRDRTLVGAVRFVTPVGEARVRTIDGVYGVAIWGIVGGIVGSRIVHVIDEWRFYLDNPGQIIAIWNGGIGLWGAILGGFIGGYLAAKFYKMPIGRLADLAALSMLPAQAVGRVGDIINGEHISKITNLPWGLVWSNPESPTYRSYGLVATHPAVVYELLWDLALFFVLYKFVWKRIKPDGMIFFAYLGFYSFGRFFIQFYRLDRIWIAGLQEAQIIALAVMLVCIPILAYRARFVSQTSEEESTPRRQPAASAPRP
jgi:phosphatidylglycerol:prolipoprotein diacylglycerol transferase